MPSVDGEGNGQACVYELSEESAGDWWRMRGTMSTYPPLATAIHSIAHLPANQPCLRLSAAFLRLRLVVRACAALSRSMRVFARFRVLALRAEVCVGKSARGSGCSALSCSRSGISWLRSTALYCRRGAEFVVEADGRLQLRDTVGLLVSASSRSCILGWSWA